MLDVEGDQRQPLIKLTESGINLANSLHEIDTSLIPKFIAAMNMNDAKKREMIAGFEVGIANFQKLSNVVNVDFEKQKPNVARIYDYLLGGHHNFEIDRQVGDLIIGSMPFLPKLSRLMRWCLQDVANELTYKRGFDTIIDFVQKLPQLYTAFTKKQRKQFLKWFVKKIWIKQKKIKKIDYTEPFQALVDLNLVRISDLWLLGRDSNPQPFAYTKSLTFTRAWTISSS